MRGAKKRAREPRLVLVLLLIGWQNDACLSLLSSIMQNRQKCQLDFGYSVEAGSLLRFTQGIMICNTHLLLTSTSRFTRVFSIKSVGISITSSIREPLAGFRTRIIIELWKESPTGSCFFRQGTSCTVCRLDTSCISWKSYIKNNTYDSVTDRIGGIPVSKKRNAHIFFFKTPNRDLLFM